MRKISRILGAVGITVAALAMTASPAQASPSSDLILTVFDCKYCSGAGYVHFNSDPNNYPGDAMRVCDVQADGWGIIAFMRNINGTLLRTATTQGHDSPYCTPWATGDLPEESYVQIIVCRAHGTTYDKCVAGDAWA